MAKILLKYNNKLLKRNGNIFTGYDGSPLCDFNANGSSASQITVNLGDTVNFNDTSLKNPTLWNWNFGSGTPSTSTLKNPTGITFSTTGLSSVSLTISNAFGTSSKTKTDYINVQGGNKKLVVSFNALPEGDVGTTPYYTGITWTPSGSTQKSWTFNMLCSDVLGLQPTTACAMALKYTDNTSSNYFVKVQTVFEESYLLGKTTGNNTGVYPDVIMQHQLGNTSWNPMIKEYIRLSGLTTSTTYKITIFGSKETNPWPPTSRYTISGGTNKDGTSVTLNCEDNTMNTVNVTGITPSASGIIDIGVDYTANIGVINAMEIDEGG